jgi:hypothetical protein
MGVQQPGYDGCRRNRRDNDDRPDSLSFHHSNTDNSLDEWPECALPCKHDFAHLLFNRSLTGDYFLRNCGLPE